MPFPYYDEPDYLEEAAWDRPAEIEVDEVLVDDDEYWLFDEDPIVDTRE